MRAFVQSAAVRACLVHTIRKYLGEGSEPRYRRSQPPVRHKLQAYEEWLQSLYEQLVEEGYTGSCAPVYRFTKDLKSDQLSSGKSFIPLAFQIGDALPFDWSEEHVVLGGVERKIKVAHFRLCHSRKTFVTAYRARSLQRSGPLCRLSRLITGLCGLDYSDRRARGDCRTQAPLYQGYQLF